MGVAFAPLFILGDHQFSFLRKRICVTSKFIHDPSASHPSFCLHSCDKQIFQV